MSRTTWISLAVMAASLVIIGVVLFMEATSGPTFRAEDHDSYEECMRNIPLEWGPGSLPRTGAEDACHYVHRRGPDR